MKIYISTDVEGLNGVTYEHQIYSQNEAFKQTRNQLHFELNTIIETLLANNVTKITVNDAHELMDNISISELPPNVRLITGKPKPISMMYGLDKTFDGVFLMGYHSKVKSKGVLSHTFSLDFNDVKVNGQTVSEAWLNAYYASTLGVPTLFASGDDIFCKEVQTEIKDITTVCTKKSIAYNGAICKKNDALKEDYKKAVTKAVQMSEKPILKSDLEKFTIEVSFKDHNKTTAFQYLPLNIEIDYSTVKYSATDFFEMYKFLQFCCCI